MAWPLLSRPADSISAALRYCDQFAYPLTLDELWFWQPLTTFSRSQLSGWPHHRRGYFYLKHRSSLVATRLARAGISQSKWRKALTAARLLKFIPSIRAIFITGALAMHNSPVYDDIDIMLVVSPHTLWFTRLAVIFILRAFRLRRPPRLPEHSSARVSDKICDNLYLDLHHLQIIQSPINQSTNLYLAHEILQAKCLLDKEGLHHQFLTANSWARHYLPIAYRETLKQCSQVTTPQLKSNPFTNLLFFTFNFSLFTLQYLYMRPHLTHEKIGLGYAFFHPRPPKSINLSRLS